MRLKHFLSVFLTLLTLSVGQMWGAVTALALPKAWDASDGKSAYTEALGCTFSTSFASDYGSAPKLKFNSEGAYLIIQVADAPDEISFNFKQNGTNAGTFKVQESTDGSTYTDALTVTWPGNGTTASRAASLNASSRYIKLVYVTKGNSTNAGVGGISITKAATSCTVKPTVGADLTSVSATANSITATVPISNIGGCNITENGLVYSSSVTTPTVGAANCTKVTTTACGATAANKTVTISDLACSTTYYVRGYATNDAGIQYTTNTKTQATSACPKYTVTLKDDDTELEQATAGASVTLPSRTGCTGYTFAGWTKSWTTAQSSWTTTAPTIINAGSYTPQADENLYPVYTKTEAGSGADTYQRVSSTAAVTDGQYLIVCEGQSKAFNGGASNLDATPNFISVTISSNTITASETTTAAEFTIGTSGDNRTITSATGYTIGRTGTTNGFESSNTSTLTNTITISSNNAIITSSGGPKLQYLNSGNNSKFRYYASSQTAIQLYKRISSSVTSYISVPNCCTSLGSINGSVNRTSPTSATLTWDAVTGAEKYQVKVPGSSSHNDWTDATSGVSVTGLACGTAHTAYFRAIDTNGSHCAEGPESTKGIPAKSWTVTATGVTHATPNEAWPATACADFSRTLTVEPGYEFPTSLTVVGADYSWAKNTGVLTIKNITGNVSITLTPTVKTYSITYKDQGGEDFSGEQTDAPETHTYGTATTLKIPTKTNYSFGGWFTSSDCTTGAVGDAQSATLGATDYTADIVLYAKWVANKHTLTYSVGDAESGSVPAEPTLYDHGDKVDVLGNTGELAKEHYVFETWTDGENEYGEGDDFNIYDDVTLSPKWACNEYVNVLKGTPTNGSFELSATGSRYTCDGAEVITVTPSANTGYAFSAIEVTGVAGAINQTAKTITYEQYAHGTSTINVTFAPVVSAITWDLNYQGAPTASSTDYTYAGEALELPAPTRTGYDFVGWFTDPTDGSQIDNVGGSNKPYAATTYYAHWTIHSYTVTFKNNGVPLASGGTRNVNYGAAYGALPVLESGDACDATSTTFMGWSDATIAEKTDEAPALVSAETTMGANDVELHAVWAKAEGGEATYNKVTSISEGIYLMATTTADTYLSQTTLAYAGQKTPITERLPQ